MIHLTGPVARHGEHALIMGGEAKDCTLMLPSGAEPFYLIRVAAYAGKKQTLEIKDEFSTSFVQGKELFRIPWLA